MIRGRRAVAEKIPMEQRPLAVVPDLFAGRQAGPELVLVGLAASDPGRFDVLSEIDEHWGQEQSLLGYPIRVRCEQADASGWEFRRAAESSPESSRRLDEDDTTLQVVALRGSARATSSGDACSITTPTFDTKILSNSPKPDSPAPITPVRQSVCFAQRNSRFAFV